jgi:hypothetical protein
VGIDWFRDLVICIGGVVFTVVIIFTTVLIYKLYLRIRAVLDNMKTTAASVERISGYMESEIAKPLVQMAAFIQGAYQGIESISKIFRKDRGGNDDK